MKALLRLRTLLVALLLALTVTVNALAADEIPGTLLAQLTYKVSTYDRNHSERRKTRPRTLVVQKANDERSARTATHVAHDLASTEAGGPVDVVTFTSAADLAQAVKTRDVSLVVLAGGLEDDMPAIAAAFAGMDVLTIGTTGTLAERGAVVGFEVREGKPKLVVNLRAARVQHVALRPELLGLARIVP